MKLTTTILIISTLATADVYQKPFIKEPLIVEFTPSRYSCTEDQLRKAHAKFKKCFKTPIFSECYGKYIMLECSRKWFR